MTIDIDVKKIITDFLIDGMCTIPRKCLPRSKSIIPSLQSFMDKSISHKLNYSQGFNGYTPFGEEHANDPTKPDMIESFVFSTRLSKGQTPPELVQYTQNEWETIVQLIKTIQSQIIKECILNNACKESKQNKGNCGRVLKRKVDKFVGVCELSMQSNYFAPVSSFESTATKNTRIGSHHDPSFITFFPYGISKNFEYKNRKGEWVQFNGMDNIALFPGLLFEYMSGGIVKSVKHRVKLPKNTGTKRFSFAVFSIVTPEFELEPFGNGIDVKQKCKFLWDEIVEEQCLSVNHKKMNLEFLSQGSNTACVTGKEFIESYGGMQHSDDTYLRYQ